MQPAPTLREESLPMDRAHRGFIGWRRSTTSAWMLCAITLALLVAEVGLIIASLLVIARAQSPVPDYVVARLTHPLSWPLTLLNDAALAGFAMLGALIVARSRSHPVGWIFCGLGWLGALEQCCKQYAVYGLLVRPGSLPLAQAAAWVTEWVWVPFAGLLGVWLPLLFPDGRLLSPRWRPAAWLATAALAVLVPCAALRPGPLGNAALLAQIANPLGATSHVELIGRLASLSFLGLLLSMVIAAAAVLIRLRRASGDERQQLKGLCYPAALLALLFVLQGVVRYVLQITAPAFEVGFALTWAAAFALLPLAAGVAILKHRLYAIDLVINRTLVYVALSAAVSAIYVLVVGGLGTLLQARGSLLISLLGTGVVAVLFGPLRAWLQRGVNRLLYGERDEPYAVLARLGRRLEATLAPQAVLPTIVATVREALKLPYAAIALRQGDEFVLAAEAGAQEPGEVEQPGGLATISHTLVTPPLVSLPLAYRGEAVGEIRLAPRSGEASFSPADWRLLEGIAHQAGVAVHATRLNADLQRSRERLVAAREEERRRLRRDLHDGLGPALATQALKLEAARDLVELDPARAVALLTDLIGESQAAIADIRRLVYALRPPALDELGLVGALREQAVQYEHLAGGTGAALRIRIDAPTALPPLPAAAEVAVYRIALEALTNVVRHASATSCTISLGAGTGLHLDIRDDGRGLPPDCRPGVGLSSMQERAAELGE
ncbi:MAG: histidine kinase, partial [Chloroflexales bacterium]|nr:histidine kinase [Chloroflexales bacterium]